METTGEQLSGNPHYTEINLSVSRVVIRAAVNIKKGEHISINYSDPMWGSANRQLHLGGYFNLYLTLGPLNARVMPELEKVCF